MVGSRTEMNEHERRQFEQEARDPATPAARLAELADEHLDAVLQNLGLPLVLLEDPDWWELWSDSARSELAQSPHCPLGFVAWLVRKPRAEHHDAWTFVLGNQSLPVAARRDLLLRSEWNVARHDFEAHPLGDPALDEVLTAPERALLVRGGRGASPDLTMTEPEVEQLVAIGGLGLYLAVGHPSCPTAVLDRFLEGLNESRAYWVISHPHLASERLTAFLASKHGLSRAFALQNPALTEAQFQAAADDADHRPALARNPALPPQLRERLLRDSDPDVRVGLAYNPVLSEADQLVLANDRSIHVWKALLHRESSEVGSLTPEARQRVEAQLAQVTLGGNDDIPF